MSQHDELAAVWNPVSVLAATGESDSPPS